ncbi:hypothetical protein EDD28_1871 [Salana multivorans]|uniref:VOC domain-containing protein n=1 Tax=Salana multivorans TaxID=120377 RepID=A0A3N2DCW2_9MICO|nr:VOC family protein [Salana multivorans]ROR97274.1 hypothetical protein EDD28_1871 [Salana multivorans]
MFFPNFPIVDIAATREFWTSLGYSFNPDYSAEDVACLVFTDEVAVMLHEPSSFARFLPEGSAPADPRATTIGMFAFDLASREAVDELFERVVAAGGSAARPTEDLGFMYTRSFRDLDGIVWEPFFMDTSAYPGPDAG